jgi:very-short-patch-repair endonuclease
MAVTNEKPGCLSVIFPFLKRSQKETTSKALPYRLRDDFLSPAEFSFYKVLLSLVGARLTIQSKVRLADVFFVVRPNENAGFFNRIAQKHLDFLVCDSVTMKPLFGIELDDSSHKRNDRQERDEFVENVCQVAGLPLLRVPVQREYNSREIAAQIAPLLKDKVSVPVDVPPQPEINKQVGSVPLCPKCGIPMVLRTVAQGEHKGKQFYGCQNYPRCREMKPVTA